MANTEQLEILKGEPDRWDQWRKENPLTEIDLSLEDLREFSFVGLNLSNAFLNGSNLQGVTMVGANLRGATLGEAYFNKTDLRGTDLRYVTFDSETDLSGIQIDNQTSLGDIHWNNVDLTVVDWEPIHKLGDEIGKSFPEISVRAYRQLAGQLRAQGMNEFADRFAYRAQVCRRKVLTKRRRLGSASWSLFLDILAGYGYRPQRSFITYLLVNLIFGVAYFLLSSNSPGKVDFSPLGAFVFSVASFHGRGFFPSNISVDDPISVTAAFEAFVGLIIEASFIATFTDRYFGK